ncbi:MAG: hypothetical protein HONBIEJF_01577 [Fimbriimonadaceae bacterium]|nr:hypothetical protein [Fimbriimonadaceae bacterium]
MLSTGALRIRDFKNLFIGQAISLFGDALYMLVFLFMAAKITGSAAAVGYVGALSALPYLVLGPLAGASADRFDRRRLMLACDLLSAVILFAFAGMVVLSKDFPVWTLYATPFALSCVNAFFAPAKNASIPRLVPENQLLEANSLNAAAQNMMPLIGLGLSGTILGTLWAASGQTFFLVSVVVNGLTFLASAAFIYLLPALRPERRTGVRASAWLDSIEGVRYVASDHFLRVAVILSFFINLFIAPFMVAYVKANDQWFGGEYGRLAAFEFAFMAGMVASSLYVARLNIKRVGLAWIGGLAVVGLCVAFMAFSSFWWFLTWNLVCGLALPIAQIPLTTYIQLTVPDSHRGRVNSAMMMVSMGVQPVGMALSGIIIERIGLVALFVAMGVGFCLSALAGLLDKPFRTATIPDQAVSGFQDEPTKSTEPAAVPCA